MLQAHILPHLLAASLTATQPTTPAAATRRPVVERRAVNLNCQPNPSSLSLSKGCASFLTLRQMHEEQDSASTSLVATGFGADSAQAALATATTNPAPAPDPAPILTPPPVPPVAVAADPTGVPGQRDPLQGFNRLSYRFTQPIDRFILRPAAITYKTVVPHQLRDGARNFIRNLFEPLVFFNDVVQLRPRRALRTVVRMALNTALGIGGIFDVAKRRPFHIEHHDNGFGDTLGYYGIGPIAYVYLPVLGPTTLRDIVGGVGDSFAEPRLLDRLVHPDSDRPLLRAKLHVGRYSAIAEIVQGLDLRAENDAALTAIRRTSVDPYASLRSSYLQDRAGEIAALKLKDGQVAVNPALDDPLNDPAAGK